MHLFGRVLFGLCSTLFLQNVVCKAMIKYTIKYNIISYIVIWPVRSLQDEEHRMQSKSRVYCEYVL